MLSALPSVAQVRLNEIVADTNERLTLADPRGRVRPGTGPFWADVGFSAPGWKTGAAPLGFGGASGLGTNVSAVMAGRTPNLYIRRSLVLTAADLANAGQLQLRVRFDDGFIAYVNGREVARANAGPAGHFIYADQKAYNFATATNNNAYTPAGQPGTVLSATTTGLTFPLGRIGDFLQEGENVIALQLMNRERDVRPPLEANVSTRIDAQLQMVTADLPVDLARFSFDDANDSAEVHRNLGGVITNSVEGGIPAGSWLEGAPPAESGPGWTDLALRTELRTGAGVEGSGALRYTYSQTDAANQPASVSGPPLTLLPEIPAGGLTAAHLANLRLSFTFRATANAAFNLRLDPTGTNPAASLTGLVPVTPWAGSLLSGTQAAADDFSDSLNSLRTRTIDPAGTATLASTGGTIRNVINFIHGPALRDAIFSVLENNTAGSGTGPAAGALEFQVVKAPVVPDVFGFSYQSLTIPGWTAGAVTPAQLGLGGVRFDYQLPAGTAYDVFLESASGTPAAADRLGLGTITGTGAWRTASLDPASGTNQTAFLTFLNTPGTTQVRVVFLGTGPQPPGTRLEVDNLGYVPSQAPPAEEFADAADGLRTRSINAAGTGTTVTTGIIKNTLNFLTGPALRDAAFSLLEDGTAGSGTGAEPGALQFEVVTPPAVFDTFGFTYQPVAIPAWTSGSITAAQLRSGAIQFDYQLPAGVGYDVFLEPVSGSPSPSDRLALGRVTGTGTWRTATLDTGSGTNQPAFLSFMNGLNINQVRVLFLSTAPLPAGSRMIVDNLGYFPWRNYSVNLASGTNQAAFLAAVNAQAVPQFVPVFEKTGRAAAPSSAVITMDNFALTFTRTAAGTALNLVPFASPGWSYFPGLAEPSGGLVEPADFTPAGGTGGYMDWVELLNAGPASVDLTGWSLTDDPLAPRKFVFPAGTSLTAGNTLVVAADGRAAPAGAVWLHAPFSLSAGGEYLALFDASGAVVDALDPGYPAQDSFHSWGRDPVTGNWGFYRTATPNAPNTGDWKAGIAEPPIFGISGGFYPAAVTLPLTTATPGGTIIYTMDGSDPTPENGLAYTGPVTVPYTSDRIGKTVRARTFATGLVPSPVTTHTYLINQHTNLRKNPAVLLSGDPGNVFYKPLGILAIQGGTYVDSQWRATAATPASNIGITDYNIPVGDGRLTDPDSSSRPYERPAFLEYYFPDNRPGIREAAGLRVSSSPYSRPRLVLNDPPTKTVWAANETLKPSLNVFFRSDYGNNSITYPLIPETEVRHFEEFRLRAGKNDISNPFIRDEFIRRLYTDMGHEGSVGTFASVYINGYFKGYYNLVERIREAFMQSHYRSSAQWDVNYIGIFEDGDNVHWNTVLQPRLAANLTVKANWDALRSVLDVTNVADYILLNTYAAMWDWPHNNWGMARERSATGLWRCYVWDAEGAFNMGGKGSNWHSLRDDLLGGDDTTPIPAMFKRLMTSPEFRLLFADRIQKHLFNDGALTNAKTAARRSMTAAEVAPLMAFTGTVADVSWYNNWVTAGSSGRRYFLFPNPSAGSAGLRNGMFRDPNQDNNLADSLWPVTPPPVFSQHGGTIAPGFQLTITHTAPAESILYYTMDGSDPRTFGGTVSPSALTYAGPFAVPATSVTIRSRVRNATTNEWSPLTESVFALATVPATAENTVVSEFMYHPPPVTTAEAAAGFDDAEDFEYLALGSIGSSPVDIGGLRFIQGITLGMDAANPRIIQPGQRLLFARNATALRFRYGAGIDAVLAGEYAGSLNNSGEAIRLETAADASPIKAFTYSDDAPWPVAADGFGPSLMLVNPESNPNHNLPASWTASAAPGGQPTGVPLTLTYAQWSVWTFTPAELAETVRTSPTGDFDGDGWPNLMEFLTGTDPRTTGPAPWTWQVVSGDGGARILRMGFPRVLSNSGYTLQVQSSTDLTVWQTDFTAAGSARMANGAAFQTWEKTAPATPARHYMRLRAVADP